MTPDESFSEEALQAQHGKKVPVTAYPGGPVIGEATLVYNPETKILGAEIHIEDPEMAKTLGANHKLSQDDTSAYPNSKDDNEVKVSQPDRHRVRDGGQETPGNRPGTQGEEEAGT